jgi:hypothetical protein
MARKKRKAKAPKKPKLTPNKLAFLEELRLLRNRANRWEREKGLRFTDFPQMPETVYKEDIARVKAIRYDNFTPQQIQQYQKEYRYFYGYTPPTEDDFYNNTPPPEQHEPEWDEDWGETDDSSADSEQEMEAWIEEKINSILNPTLIEREREGAKDLLRNLMGNAKTQMGTKGFYKFLQEPENAEKLEAAAHAYMQSYQKRNGTDTGEPELEKFVQTLNLGRPLTDEQAYELQAYGSINLDYSDTEYDEW